MFVFYVKMSAKKYWLLWFNLCRENLFFKALKIFQTNLQKDLFVKIVIPSKTSNSSSLNKVRMTKEFDSQCKINIPHNTRKGTDQFNQKKDHK